MRDYEVKINFCSKELGLKERIQLKALDDMVLLNDLTKQEEVIIDFDYYAEVSVHNGYSKDRQDYNNYIFVDKNGIKYRSGSESLYEAFELIYSEINQEMENTGEIIDFSIKVSRKPSKNRADQSFLTCILV